MKKTTYEEYQEFINQKKEELEQAKLLQWMNDYTRLSILYGRLIIEIYNKFLKNKDEEQR